MGSTTTPDNNEWQYHDPTWEHLALYDDTGSPWWGHKRFVYDLIRHYAPRRIVELGTHKGTSFFAMCQAAKDGGQRDAMLISVDNWRGDEHAGYFGPEVKDGVAAVLKECYPTVHHVLLEDDFTRAAIWFHPESIDLLHIDGCHTYEAVKRDFETWLPMVAKGGFILLHDTALRHDPFGVCTLWAQVSEQYPSFEFLHSCGLGVLRVGAPLPDESITAEWRRHYQTAS